MEILDVECGIQGPKIVFDEEHVTDATASPSNNPGSRNLSLTMGIGWAARRNQRILTGSAVFLWKVKPTL